jgi:hypothetical protein
MGAFNQTVGSVNLFGESVANMTKGFAISSGVAFNPYKQLMYDSPEFRNFSFSWILSPKNASESKAIHEIILQLKKSMHPKTMGTSPEDTMIWLSPDFIDFSFILEGDSGEQKNVWLPVLKRSAIKDLSVNYETKFHGGSAGNEAGAPAAISMTLDLLETTILTQRDFEGTDGKNLKQTP